MKQAGNEGVIETQTDGKVASGKLAADGGVGFELGAVFGEFGLFEVGVGAGVELGGFEVDDPDVGVGCGKRCGAGEEGAVGTQAVELGADGGLTGRLGVEREDPEAGGVGERGGEGVEGALGFAEGLLGREAFAAEAGEEARLPLGEFAEEVVGGGGFEAVGEELEVAVDYVAEGSDGEGAFGAVEGRGEAEG